MHIDPLELAMMLVIMLPFLYGALSAIVRSITKDDSYTSELGYMLDPVGSHETNPFTVQELAQEASKLAGERASYASVPAISAGDVVEPVSGTKFKVHKLECDNCGGPLSVDNSNLATCGFCNSQYYLEGFRIKKDKGYVIFENATCVSDGSIRWVNGGVSMRHVTYEEIDSW